MHLSLNAVACAMRTKNSGVQDRRAHSARYPECANVVCFDLDSGPHPWMPACAGMTGSAWFFVIPAKAGIQSARRQEV